MSHQKVTTKFPTLERLALNRVRERFPELQRGGFSAAICAIDPEIKSGYSARRDDRERKNR
jgi:hypothetical protein